MICDYCGKEIDNKDYNFISFNVNNRKTYYCNEVCYSLRVNDKECTKKINELLKFYFSDNNNLIKVPSHYYMKYSKLIGKNTILKQYGLYFLVYNRKKILQINKQNKFKHINITMYCIWKFIEDNFYTYMTNYFVKKEQVDNIISDNKVKVKRRINRLLEEEE